MTSYRVSMTGGYTLTIEVCREISRECVEEVHRIYRVLERFFREELRAVRVEIVVGLSAITLYYDPRIYRGVELVEEINRVLEESRGSEIGWVDQREWVIPVLYGGEYGPDLESIATEKGLSIEEVVEIHSSRKYLCYAIGFTPGFIYLGEVDERISVPRLGTPRTRIPRGSVGIAGVLTGVYSVESPGGWRIIGRTPLKMFDPKIIPPTPVRVGDIVVFKPISREEYRELEGVFIGEYRSG